MKLSEILKVECTTYDFKGSGLNKICVLTSQLDGYEEDRHPEFHSESNVFYTTIRNVNYPPKDEIADAKVGSSDAKVGSSNPSKVGSSDAKVGSSNPSKVGGSDANRGSSYRGSSKANEGSYFETGKHPVDIYGKVKRLTKEELTNKITTFCSEWRSPDNISIFIGKDLRYVKEKILPQMVKAGVLERLYPETPNHPKQKYRTKAND